MAAQRYRPRHRLKRGVLPRLFGGVGAWTARIVWHPRLLLLTGLAVAAAWAGQSWAMRAEVFRITRVETSPSLSSLSLPRPLIGTNLWALDLQALAEELGRAHPSLKDVRVARQLPNVIRIQGTPRVAVAQVRVDRWHPVDRQGFILTEASDGPSNELVRLVGFGPRGAGLKIGRENADQRLALGLRAVEVLQRAPIGASRRVTEVNVEDPEQIRFLIDDEIEVRCGSEAELASGLQRLRAALDVLTKHAMAAQSIDVRFQEPVIVPRA